MPFESPTSSFPPTPDANSNANAAEPKLEVKASPSRWDRLKRAPLSEYVTWLREEPELHLRWAVRIAAAVIFVLAGTFYAFKAAEDRSAFLRWRIQVLQLDQGVNIYDSMLFPTPPIMPLMLYPIMKLPPVAGALVWFLLKCLMALASVIMCFRMARPRGGPVPAWAEAVVLILASRPILSDLHHGNNNLFILFLVVSSVYLWTRSRDGLAGLLLGLAVCSKITPALFGVYYFWKWSWPWAVARWRTWRGVKAGSGEAEAEAQGAKPSWVFGSTWKALAASVLGLVLFLEVVPSAILGADRNHEFLATWWRKIMRPYVSDNIVGAQEMNQSMVGVLTRLLTEQKSEGRYGVKLDINFVALDRKQVAIALKGLSIAMVLAMLWLCRTRSSRRDDPRLLGEFALVVLTMLFVSERSWKHHYVTLLLPLAYLACRVSSSALPVRDRVKIGIALASSGVLMALTSREGGYVLVMALGISAIAFALFRNREQGEGWLTNAKAVKAASAFAASALLCFPAGMIYADQQYHKTAQAFGMFFWSGVALWIATAWRLAVEAKNPIPLVQPSLDSESATVQTSVSTAPPRPHFSMSLSRQGQAAVSLSPKEGRRNS